MKRPDHKLEFRSVVDHIARFAVLGFFVLLFLHLKVSVEVNRDYRPYIFDGTYDLPGSRVLRAVSLNHRTAAADLLWVDAVQFVANAAVSHRTADDVTYYADAITDLDPYFHKVYSWHAASRMLIAGYPSPADIEAANDILEKGMTYFPEDWRLPYEAAANYIGFTRGVDEETRRHQLERGRRYAEAAAQNPRAPESMVLLATRFDDKLRRLDQDDEAATEKIDGDTLFRLYLLARTDKARQSIRNRLLQHDKAELFVEELNDYEMNFRRRYRASKLNYLPRQLFSLISSRVTSNAVSEPEYPGEPDEK